MNKAFIIAISFLVVALAGCAGEEDPAEDLKNEFNENSGDSGSGEGGAPTNGGEPGGSGEPAEPGEGGEPAEPKIGTLAITFGADQSVAQAPATIQFSVSAKALNPDGTEDMNATIDWAIFDAENSTSGIDEFGQGNNATINFTFNTAGTFEIVAGVSADGFESAFATATINVTAEPVTVPNPQIVAGSYTLGFPTGCILSSTGGPTKGVVADDMTIEDRVKGGIYEFTMTFDTGVAPVGHEILIRDAASGTLEFVEVPDGTTVTGTMYPNADHLILRTCGVGATVDWTVTIFEP